MAKLRHPWLQLPPPRSLWAGHSSPSTQISLQDYLPQAGAADFGYVASGGLTTGGAAAANFTPAGTTYSFTATGGLATGGAATIARRVVRSVTASGGVTVSGTALWERTRAWAATGGLVLSGAATVSRTFNPVEGGNLVSGGAATLRRSWAWTASGGLVSGGAGLWERTSSVVASGGVSTGGAALAGFTAGSVAYPYTGAGGVTLGGTAALARRYQWAASGGLLTGGAARLTITWDPQEGGDLASGGAAAVSRRWTIAASGGVVLGGAADALQDFQAADFPVVGEGGVVLGGEATVARARVFTYVAQPPELPSGPGPEQPPVQQVVRAAGSLAWMTEGESATTVVYLGGGRFPSPGGEADVQTNIAPPPSVLEVEGGGRVRFRGSANAYPLRVNRRARDAEALALANLARTAA